MDEGRWLRAAAGLASAGAAVLVSAGAAAPASATPGSGVDVETLSQATGDGQDYITKRITIAPGGSTGWHWHPGQLFGVIREGALTHNISDCSEDGYYPAGSPLTEGSGPDNVHEGRNLGPVPVVMWVTYISPAGGPLAIDVPNPGCPFE